MFFARHHFPDSLIVEMGLDDLGPGAVVALVELFDRIRLGFFNVDLLTVELLNFEVDTCCSLGS
jgi:hypothetical protein